MKQTVAPAYGILCPSCDLTTMDGLFTVEAIPEPQALCPDCLMGWCIAANHPVVILEITVVE